MTNELKKQIYTDYCDKRIPLRELEGKYGIPRGRLAHIAVEQGASPRKSSFGKNHSKNVKVCPKCHRRVELKGAIYCPFCATDLRSERDKIIERLECDVMPNLCLLPTSLQEAATAAVAAAMHELARGEGK